MKILKENLEENEENQQEWITLKNIQDWWWMNIGYRIRNFFRSIKNVIRWFPIIWKDKDWDDSYIFKILKFKLQNQAKYIGDRDWHESAKRDAEIMLLCTRLIDKLVNDDYGIEYFDYHETKFRFIDIPDKPGYKEMLFDEISEHYDDYFKKYPLIYKRVINGEQWIPLKDREEKEIKHLIAMNIAHINEKRVSKLLFKILEENIQKWWD